jgi:hypothetical protein
MEDQDVLVILNFGATNTFLKIEGNHNLISGNIVNLLNDELYHDFDINKGLDLKPHDVLVLTRFQGQERA